MVLSIACPSENGLTECRAEPAAKLNQLLAEEVSREKKQLLAVAFSRR